MTEETQFIVVGAGLLGLAVTRELARRGRDVLCVEQATIGHERAGSKGTSRLFRYGYEDPFYVGLAMKSLAGWRRLSEESGARLLEPVGLLSLGDGLDALVAAMAEAGASSEFLSGEELTARFPSFAISGRAVFEATAGVLRADEILSVLARSARGFGAEILEGARVGALEAGDDSVRLQLPDGSRRCDIVVLCGGAWSGDLAAAAGLAPRGTFRPSLQQVAYLEPKAGVARPEPAFVERGEVTYYGLPTPATGHYKIGIHDPGESLDPATASLDDDPAALELLVAAAERLLPGFRADPVGTERCFYDNTADADFVIDRRGRVVIGAGTSGHGFKFAPLLAIALADLAEGSAPSLPRGRFSLGRFSPGRAR
ncbi:MAG TPA: FAD-dependent oxidoreductase [Acidimicrobiales bacterium]|nr:FAD-dependent oxidoreductase [Acidimicrobiales bacterium]